MSRILFVDDEPNTLEGYQRLLRRRFQIDTAIGAQEALDAIRCRGPYAVVVADVRMPDMTGIELLMEVREAAPQTVRIVLTGNADQKTAVDARERGKVFRYLGKPCSPQMLIEALEAGLTEYASTTAEANLLTIHG